MSVRIRREIFSAKREGMNFLRRLDHDRTPTLLATIDEIVDLRVCNWIHNHKGVVRVTCGDDEVVVGESEGGKCTIHCEWTDRWNCRHRSRGTADSKDRDVVVRSNENFIGITCDCGIVEKQELIVVQRVK